MRHLPIIWHCSFTVSMSWTAVLRIIISRKRNWPCTKECYGLHAERSRCCEQWFSFWGRQVLGGNIAVSAWNPCKSGLCTAWLFWLLILVALKILRDFHFPCNEGMVPFCCFPSLTSLPDNVILKANKFSGMLFLILVFHKMTLQSVQAALNSERYAACSVKVVSENFGLDIGPFGS